MRRTRPQLEWLEDRTVLDAYHVTSLLDSGPGTLRDAITQANAHPGKDTIVFDVNGTITITSALPNLADDVDFQGPGVNNLTISGPLSGGGQFRVFTVNSGVTVNFSSLTMRTLLTFVDGDVLYNDGGTVTTTNCTLSCPNSSGEGGVIYNNAGTLTINGCNVVSSSFSAKRGGAIFNNLGTVTISNSQVSGSGSSDGGAIYNNGTMTVSDTTLSGLASQFGGAIDNVGTMTVTGSTLSGGFVAGSGDGGAIANSGTMTVTRCTLTGHAAGAGGGIYNSGNFTLGDSTVSGCFVGEMTLGSGGGIANSGTMTVTDSTISGNSAKFSGGGISNGGSLTVSNSTISGNITTNALSGLVGGAGIVTAFAAPVTLTNVTITNNRSATAGGGILTDPRATVTPVLHNVLIAGNSCSVGYSGNDVYGSVDPSSDYNLIGDGTGMTGISNGTNHNQVGTAASPINALLAPLGN
jgi:hypothetical protein